MRTILRIGLLVTISMLLSVWMLSCREEAPPLPRAANAASSSPKVGQTSSDAHAEQPQKVPKGQPDSGSWWKARERKREEETKSREIDIETLTALGYLGGYQEAPDFIGVTEYDSDKAFNGANLYVSGHSPTALLIDMRGKLLHKWEHPAPEDYNVKDDRNFWRKVYLFPNGDLLAIFDPHGIIKLNAGSDLLWATPTSYNLHHDLDVTEDGKVYALGKRTRVIPDIHPSLKFVEDLVYVLGADGQKLDSFSIIEAFRETPFEQKMFKRLRSTAVRAYDGGKRALEDFHTNTLEIFDGSLVEISSLFARGNMIFCSPHHNNVWIIDGKRHKVIWNWFGPWNRIHEASIVPPGHLLLFHNGGYQNPDEATSEVLEYKPFTQELVWKYRGDPSRPETAFFSGTSSTALRLENGNTLFVVTESGRAVEVTREKDVVWEFYNPARAGRQLDLIAAIFQLERIPKEEASKWPWLSVRTERGQRRRSSSR